MKGKLCSGKRRRTTHLRCLNPVKEGPKENLKVMVTFLAGVKRPPVKNTKAFGAKIMALFGNKTGDGIVVRKVEKG